MTEIQIVHKQDGVYWRSGLRERRITGEQAVRLLNLVWQKSSGCVETEGISVLRFQR